MRPPSSDTASAAPAVALSRREQRRLGALGHHLAQWREALELLRRRHEKGELPAASREHIGACLALLPASSEVTRREVGVLIEHKPEARWCATIAAVGDTAEISAAARALIHWPCLLGGLLAAGRQRQTLSRELCRRSGTAGFGDAKRSRGLAGGSRPPRGLRVGRRAG